MKEKRGHFSLPPPWGLRTLPKLKARTRSQTQAVCIQNSTLIPVSPGTGSWGPSTLTEHPALYAHMVLYTGSHLMQ